MTQKKYFFPVLLAGLLTIFILLTVPNGYLYGSYTDWLSQHVRLAETIRSACLEQHTLTPAFLPIGGGSNGYLFSYYGYLRPDILIGCLFPSVPMVNFVIGYMLAGYFTSVLLCYAWLVSSNSRAAFRTSRTVSGSFQRVTGTPLHTSEAFRQGNSEVLPPFLAFIGSLLFMTAACFFQTHRQIMFVNYMPFLLLALLAVKKGRQHFLPLILFLIYVNSFYYSIACLAVIGWYWLMLEGRSFWKNGLACYLKSVFLSIGMAAVLLIPTALVILEHRRESEPLSLTEIFGPAQDLGGLLYSPYGMGLTIICLYLLLIGLGHKKYRMDSIFLLIVSSWSFAAWILNGTLYTRGKILIPFLPLVILQCSNVLHALLSKDAKLHWKLWPFFLFAASYPAWAFLENHGWIIADMGIAAFVVVLQKLRYRENVTPFWNTLSCVLLCIMPCLIFLQTMQKDNFVKKGDATTSDLISETESNTISRPLYRSDSLIDPLNSCNLADKKGVQKSSMYSSITNKDYASVYYDTFLSPVQINNSVAILPSANPFLLHFLGVRYLETTADHIPCGYQIVPPQKDGQEDGPQEHKEPGQIVKDHTGHNLEQGINTLSENRSGLVKNSCVLAENSSVLAENSSVLTENSCVLAENRNVLPAAYVTSTTMNESQFLSLNSYDRLDAITRYTIIPDPKALNDTNHVNDAAEYSSHMQDYFPIFKDTDLPDTISISKSADGYLLKVKKKTNVTFLLQETLKKKILLLDFQIVNHSTRAVVIDINGMRNKLSGASAPYPNGNHTFHYQFSDSSGEGLNRLNVTFSKGTYLIKNENWHLYDELLLSRKQFTSIEPHKTKDSEILSCTADAGKDGYFVTSIPLQKGMEILVDGKNVPILKVNQAFAGAELTKGKHDIRIIFHAPGQKAGYWISILSLLIWGTLHLRYKLINRSKHTTLREKVFR